MSILEILSIYALYGFIEGTLVIFYTLLISIKLHIILMLIHIGNEMEPFRRDDNEAFLADIIGMGTHHYEEDATEDDGSQYLNDTGDGNGDDNQTEQTTVQEMS
jgi:hypothetical protein